MSGRLKNSYSDDDADDVDVNNGSFRARAMLSEASLPFTSRTSQSLYPGENYVSRRSRDNTRKKAKNRGRSLSPVRLSASDASASVKPVDPESLMIEPVAEQPVVEYAEKKYVRNSKSEDIALYTKPSSDIADPLVQKQPNNDRIDDAEKRADQAEAQQNFANFGEEYLFNKRRVRFSFFWSVLVCMLLAAGIAGLVVSLSVRGDGKWSAASIAQESAKHTNTPMAIPNLTPATASIAQESAKHTNTTMATPNLTPATAHVVKEEEESVVSEEDIASAPGTNVLNNAQKDNVGNATSSGGEGIPAHILHAPAHLQAICTLRESGSKSECEVYCSKAECCWKDGVESCTSIHASRCGAYAEACGALNEATQAIATNKPLIEGGAGKSNLVPPAPDNLSKLCALDTLTTDKEHKEVNQDAFAVCKEACDKASCCWKAFIPLFGSSCDDNPNCAPYSEICEVLIDLL